MAEDNAMEEGQITHLEKSISIPTLRTYGKKSHEARDADVKRQTQPSVMSTENAHIEIDTGLENEDESAREFYELPLTPRSKVRAMLQEFDDTAQDLGRPQPEAEPQLEERPASLFEKLKLQLDQAKQKHDSKVQEVSDKAAKNLLEQAEDEYEEPSSMFVPSSPIMHRMGYKEVQPALPTSDEVKTPNVFSDDVQHQQRQSHVIDDDSDDDIVVGRVNKSRRAMGAPLSSPEEKDVSNAYMDMFFESPKKKYTAPPLAQVPAAAKIELLSVEESEKLANRKSELVKGLSKKEQEFASKETLRIERELQLAPEMHTTKFVSVDDFINDFQSPPSSPKSKGHATPGTSPIDVKLNKDFGEEDKVLVTPKKNKRPIGDFLSPMLAGLSKSPNLLKTPNITTRTPEDQKYTPKITPRRLTSFVNNQKNGKPLKKVKITTQSRPISQSDDSDLEIVPTTAASVMPKAIRKLGKLANIDIYGATNSNSNSSSTFMSLLSAKQAEQARKARDERLSDLKKRGIEINEKDTLKEKEMLEDLLERERKRAEELAEKEKPEGKDILDDEYDDPDYGTEHAAEDVVENVYRSENEEESDLEADGDFSNSDESPDSGDEADVDVSADDEDNEDEPVSRLDGDTQPVHSDGPVLEVQSSMIQDSDLLPTQTQNRRKRMVLSDEEEDDDDEDDMLIKSQDDSQILGAFFEASQATQATSAISPHAKAEMQRRPDTPITDRLFNPVASLVDSMEATQQVRQREDTGYSFADDAEDEDIYREPRIKPSRDHSFEPEVITVAPRKQKKLKLKQKLSDAGKALFDEEADESDDEWAHLGGGANNSDDENEEEAEGYNLQGLVDDDSKENVNALKIQQLMMEAAKNEDSELVHKLMEDVTNGGWRKRRAANGLLGDDLFDLDEDKLEYMQQLQRRAERKKQKLLEEESLSEIINNERAKAFVESIADDTNVTTSFLDVVDFPEEKPGAQSEDQQETEAEATGDDESDVKTVTNETKVPTSEPVPIKRKHSSLFSIDSIRKSLSFLDEDADPREETHEDPTGHIDDDFLPRRITMIDRKSSYIASIASRAASAVADGAMPPPRLTSFRAAQTTSSINTVSYEAPTVQITKTVSSSQASTKLRTRMVRQRVAKKESPDQTHTKRVLATKARSKPQFFRGGSFE